MLVLKRTEEFNDWLDSLKDSRAVAKVLVRLERLKKGNLGDVEPAGAGISELRIHYGPGYRIYVKRKGETVTALLGGDKGSQDADIHKAKGIASTLED